jgi:hypothetical protein
MCSFHLLLLFLDLAAQRSFSKPTALIGRLTRLRIAVDASGEGIHGKRTLRRRAQRSLQSVQLLLVQLTSSFPLQDSLGITVLHSLAPCCLSLGALCVFIRPAPRKMGKSEPAGNAPVSVHGFQFFT